MICKEQANTPLLLKPILAALFSINKSIASFLVSSRQPSVIDVEVMYDHVPTFTQEKKKKQIINPQYYVQF